MSSAVRSRGLQPAASRSSKSGGQPRGVARVVARGEAIRDRPAILAQLAPIWTADSLAEALRSGARPRAENARS